jgi:hypothetical protein
MPNFLLKSCALHRKSSGGACRTGDDSEAESQDPEFQKEYLNIIHKESTPVMPNEIGNLFRELPRDTEIVVLFKRISDERVIARPDAELCGAALRCERKAAEQLVEAIKER